MVGFVVCGYVGLWSHVGCFRQKKYSVVAKTMQKRGKKAKMEAKLANLIGNFGKWSALEKSCVVSWVPIHSVFRIRIRTDPHKDMPPGSGSGSRR